jgi:hypothetical protein
VGLLAHPGQTDVRVTAKATSLTEAERMMAPVLETIRQKLQPYIYGENEVTLELAVSRLLNEKQVQLAIIEAGTHGEIKRLLDQHIPELVKGEFLDVNLSKETLHSLMAEYRNQHQSDMVLGVRLTSNEDQQVVLEALDFRGEAFEIERSYGGPPGDGQIWAVNSALDLIRRNLIG